METLEIKRMKPVSDTLIDTIKVPYYAKDNCHAHYISENGKAISVCHNSSAGIGIKACSVETAYYPEQETPCTKEEFDALYQQVAMKLALLVI